MIRHLLAQARSTPLAAGEVLEIYLECGRVDVGAEAPAITSLENFLARNRDRLDLRHGFRRPDHARKYLGLVHESGAVLVEVK